MPSTSRRARRRLADRPARDRDLRDAAQVRAAEPEGPARRRDRRRLLAEVFLRGAPKAAVSRLLSEEFSPFSRNEIICTAAAGSADCALPCGLCGATFHEGGSSETLCRSDSFVVRGALRPPIYPFCHPTDARQRAGDEHRPLGATLNGNVTPNGHATNARFQYGTSTNYRKRRRLRRSARDDPVPIAAALAGLKSTPSTTSGSWRRAARARTAAPTGPSGRSSRARRSRLPNPPVYGRPVTISGQLVGTGGLVRP